MSRTCFSSLIAARSNAALTDTRWIGEPTAAGACAQSRLDRSVEQAWETELLRRRQRTARWPRAIRIVSRRSNSIRWQTDSGEGSARRNVTK